MRSPLRFATCESRPDSGASRLSFGGDASLITTAVLVRRSVSLARPQADPRGTGYYIGDVALRLDPR